MSEYLDYLDFRPDEFVSIFYKRGDEQHYSVLPPAAVDYAISAIPEGFDVYLAPNPTRGPARTDTGGRGTMADVTRVNAVYADLDMKEGGCADEITMNAIVGDLCEILGTRPTCTIFSGGGMQPIWMLDDCDPKTGAKLLKRFGRLAKQVAEMRKAKVDSVFDTARVLRMPDTYNHKYSPPRLAELSPDGGAPLLVTELDERLDEAGVYDLGDDDLLGTEVIARPSDSLWAVTTCGYMNALMTAWETEPVQDRHPWLLCQFVRLECARRYSCMTEADYLRGVSVLITRFTRECGRAGDTRSVKSREVKDIRIEAESRASRKTDAQLSMELGGNEGHTHSLSSMVVPSIVLPTVAETMIVNSIEPQVNIVEPVPGILDAENNFWDRRDVLKEIYDFALSRMCSPWAVLGSCAAMALAWVRPNTTLPSLTGGEPGSLNFYVTIAAGSGQGKSSAIGAAARLMPVKPFSTSIGSGEGMLESFAMRSTEGMEKKIGTRESVLIEIDEFDLLQAMSSRTGSSLISLLKTGFTGGKLELNYVNRKYPVLKQNSYRIGMIAAVQPGKAGWLFQDQAGGFPQRFMWFPGNDGRIRADLWREISYTMGLVLPGSEEFTYPREVSVPEIARQYVVDNRAMGGQGDYDAGLNSHAAFTRLKFAYALTVLDGRFAGITEEDWELSGIAAKVSDLTRDWVQQGIKKERTREATERGEYQGTIRAVAEDEQQAFVEQRMNRIAAFVFGKVKDAGSEGISLKELRNKTASRDKRYLPVILTKLTEDGVLTAMTGPRGGQMWRTAAE